VIIDEDVPAARRAASAGSTDTKGASSGSDVAPAVPLDQRERTGGKAGAMNPTRTLPVSATLAGVERTGGKAGAMNPTRTLPVSDTLAGALITLCPAILFTLASNSRAAPWRRPNV
jgi:hypothetical protein